MVETTKPRIRVERQASAVASTIKAADTDSEAYVDRESGHGHWSAVSVEANKRGAAKADPASVPVVIRVEEQARRIDDTIVPPIWVRSFIDVSWPRCIGDVVVVNLYAFAHVIVDADDLVGSVDGYVESPIAGSDPVSQLVKRRQAILSLDRQVV
jgi:hypothetical protein